MTVVFQSHNKAKLPFAIIVDASATQPRPPILVIPFLCHEIVVGCAEIRKEHQAKARPCCARSSILPFDGLAQLTGSLS
jgi:hypothetical protein